MDLSDIFGEIENSQSNSSEKFPNLAEQTRDREPRFGIISVPAAGAPGLLVTHLLARRGLRGRGAGRVSRDGLLLCVPGGYHLG